MEQIIAALITAIVTLLVALITVPPALKSLRERLDSRAEILQKEHGDIKDKIKQVASAAAFLRDARLQDDARREQLKNQQIDIQKIIDTLVSLTQENARLKEENLKLKQQFQILQGPSCQNDQEPDWEP